MKALLLSLISIFSLSGCFYGNPMDMHCAFVDDPLCQVFGYPSHKEISKSWEGQCLILEKIVSNSRPEYGDFLYFEGGIEAGGPNNAEETMKVGESYKVLISPYYGKERARLLHDDERGEFKRFISCSK
ncbi:MAG: hypothetical protein GX765_05080 [Candidatus Moranbacteria bacterium]|jgi:hypothetical protein|nr:hypothetical protein [Candidatus Moranbacteria bacterium]